MRKRTKSPQPGLWEVTRSVAAAFFGVQSSRQRKRDFTHGNPLHYVLIGLLMTLALSSLLWASVQLALHHAG